MAGLSQIINPEGLKAKGVGLTLLDFVYGRNVILLNDALEILLGGGIPLPIPLIGFQFKTPDEVTLLSYKWTEYPFLNKQTATNGYVKESARFSIEAVKPITGLNSVFLNQGINEAMVTLLDKYVSNGGSFTIITNWKIIKNCYLEKLRGVKAGDNDLGGQGWIFDFVSYGELSGAKKRMSAFLQSVTGGTI